MKRPNIHDYNLFNGMECTKYIHALHAYCEWLEEQNEALEKRDNILRALEHGGVDNWEWYGEALDVLDDNGKFK